MSNLRSALSSSPTISEDKKLEMTDFPVVGKDNDGLLITMSLKQCKSLPKEAREEINTYKAAGYERMVENLISLIIHKSSNNPNLNNDNKAEGDKNTASKDLNIRNTIRNQIEAEYNVGRFGVGSAYECYIAHKLNRQDTEGREPLSPAWKIIVEKNNVSVALAMNLRDIAKEEGMHPILRLDERTSNSVRKNSAAKPSIIKLKVCNWGWMNECVPKDQNILGKTSGGTIIPSAQYQTPQTSNPEKYPNQIATKQLTLTRQEILESLASGQTVIDLKNTNDKYLAVKPLAGKNNSPHDTQVTFRAEMTPIESASKNESANNLFTSTTLEKPNFWRESWGDFRSSLDNPVKAEYQPSADQAFVPLETYVIPVIKDEKRLSKSVAFNPLQHGFESRNPGIQSNIDSLSLATDPSGEPRKLINERELIKYLTNNAEDQAIHINQNWNMKHENWGHLVESQIKLGVDVEPGTAASFLKEYRTNTEKQFDKPLFSNCLALADKLGDEGREIRGHLCHLIGEKLEQGSAFTREDFSKIQNQMKKHELSSSDPSHRSEAEEAYKALQEGYTKYIHQQPSAPRISAKTEVNQNSSLQEAPEDDKESRTTPKPHC